MPVQTLALDSRMIDLVLRTADHTQSTPKLTPTVTSNLNHSGRIVEALQLFDIVLKFNPNFPQALVSKADGLLYMLRAANTEITISLFLEVHNLFTKALKSPIHLDVIKKTVESGLQKSKAFLQDNNFDFTKIGEEEELNKIEYQKHPKEIKYYLDNFLSLSEHGLYCKCNGAKIDNLVIGYPGLITNDKKIIHLEILHNRIKSKFSLSIRLYFDYLFKESSDNIHYEDLSFDIQNGIKYEKLRTSFRLCFGILDKIAEGICYLFDLDVGEKENIYFENFWNHYNDKSDRWKKINSFNNIHLTALFSIAYDLNKKKWRIWIYRRFSVRKGMFVFKIQ